MDKDRDVLGELVGRGPDLASRPQARRGPTMIVPPGAVSAGEATNDFVDSVTPGWSALGAVGPGALDPERPEPTRGRRATAMAVTAMAAAATVAASRNVRRRQAPQVSDRRLP
ncbi:hypothetical protein ACFXMT_33945 [Streptomyces mirabilis]|uniref:hypothetical protein n=1 Tax=Streptomyces mirabilis TaxID=68239 RepID=UPI0036C46830